MRRFSIALTLTLAWQIAFGSAPIASDVAQPAGQDSQTPNWAKCISDFWESEYQSTERGLSNGPRYEPGKNPHIYDDRALLYTTDTDPVGVQIRRASALIDHLRTLRGCPDLSAFESALRGIADEAKIARAANDSPKLHNLYISLRAVTRKIAFANPLLGFNDMLFMGYVKPGGDYHMVDQYVGWNAKRGGGIFVLRNFKTSPAIVDVLKGSTVRNGRFKGQSLGGGAFLRPDLSFDGKRILFAWNNVTDKCYHIFSVNADGSDLTQLTDGESNFMQLGTMDSSHNDFDPCWLPDGRIAFLSDRRGGYGRCHGRPLMSYTLYSMKPDGSDIIPLSYHETNEWNPSVDNDGKIVYTRWDYIDRDDCIAHHLWTCFPDGRDPRSPHGNYPYPLSHLDKDKGDGRGARPNGEWNIRAIPDTRSYTATAGGHHSHSFGELVMIDTSVPDDGRMSQIKGIAVNRTGWPDQPGDYGTAWPLSQDFYLCNYRDDIILLDRFGNKELICPASPMPVKVAKVIHPIPLKPRPAPPVIPTATYQGERASVSAPKATISVMNVFDGDMSLPEGTTIKSLRVIEIIPQLTPIMNAPRMGYGTESLARMPLGVVPVEKDGSVQFKAPVGKVLYFQLLDERGLAVRSMRSGTYVHPGEKLVCQGCHESRDKAPAKNPMVPIALRRAPSDIKPEVASGAIPFNWHILAKPILEAKCASCHIKEGKGPDMTYKSLEKYVFHYPFWTNGFANGEITASGSRSIPGKFGAMASPMFKCLDSSHYGVSLTPDEFRRITLWMDCNGNELGTYTHVDEQRHGQIVWPEIDVDANNPLGTEF